MLSKRVAVLALPLYHVFALTVNCLLFLRAWRDSGFLITNPRDIDVSLLKSSKNTALKRLQEVNTLFNRAA